MFDRNNGECSQTIFISGNKFAKLQLSCVL